MDSDKESQSILVTSQEKNDVTIS